MPGEKAGGPVSSIKNLCDSFYKNFDFYVVCLNHDLDGTAYNVETGKWLNKNSYFVMYLRDLEYTKEKIRDLCKDFKIIYSCGLFEKSSIWTSRYFRKTKKICIAPMGCLYPSALKHKKIKKRIFIFISNVFRFYSNVIWSASSDEESKQIRHFYGNKSNIVVASDPVVYAPFQNGHISSERGSVRIAFISRISRVKNLDFALNVLRLLPSSIKVVFDIYGFAEDKTYLDECLKLIGSMPDHVCCTYLGSINHEKVKETLANYDCLLLPTKGENFGHAIYESLSAGLFLIISDTTIWNFLEKKGCAKCLKLDSLIPFQNAIFEYANLTSEEKGAISNKCIFEAKNYFDDLISNSGFLRMFENEK